MAVVAYVHNNNVLRAYQSLYKKLKTGGIFVHLQKSRFFESGSDKKKRITKERKMRRHYMRMMRRDEVN